MKVDLIQHRRYRLLDVLLYLMETLLHGYIMLMFFTAVSKGSACEAPSSPECYRKNVYDSVYTCDWSMNTTNTNVIFDLYFDLYFNKKRFRNINKTSMQITEEQLITIRAVNVWVEARVGNSSCTSPMRSVELGSIVRYDAPQNISLYWLKHNLSLTWKAASNYPAVAEIWVRRHGHSDESWGKILRNATMLTAHSTQEVCLTPKKDSTPKYQVTLMNLMKNSSYQVQIRHHSSQVKNPLWSKWSPVVIVPAALDHKPEVKVTTKLLSGTREVTLSWKPMPHAAGGVTYRVEDTQFSAGCPCARTEGRRHRIRTNNYTVYVTYSAVNISITARNAAGCSPPAIIQVPAEPPANLTSCDEMLNEQPHKRSCKQWYRFQDGESRLENVISLSCKRRQQREQERKSVALLKDYVGYHYFEHVCDDGRPRTVKMCLFYKKEGAPLREPLDFSAFNETHDSANLSWRAIASVDQRGFLTHYRLCSVKISSHDQLTECFNISSSLVKYRLENLTPGANYNISLAGVTRVGEGPKATITINTLSEKTLNVWLSFGLLFVFFLSSTLCTVILKRIKNKIFPPVPTPVVPDFSPGQHEGPEMLEWKEEVDELMLLQLHPEVKSVPDDVEETTAFRGEWDAGSDKDVENGRSDFTRSGETSVETPVSMDEALRSPRKGEISDFEQVDKEIAMLIYRNGLVFDVRMDSP